MFRGGTVRAQKVETESTKLESAKAKWEALQNRLGPLNYKFGLSDFSSLTELSTSYIVLVEQNEISTVEPFFWSDKQPNPAKFLIVDEFFDLIESNIEIGSSISAIYDDVYGYPLELIIDNKDNGVRMSYSIDPMTIYSEAQAELDMNLALWKSESIKDYDFSLRLSCFCIPSATRPKRIEVRGGEIDTIFDVGSGTKSENFFYHTVEGQFEEIQDAINDRWYVVSTGYNDTLGYPASVYFDFHPGMSDDERKTEIKDVVILEFFSVGAEDSVDPTNSPLESPSQSPSEETLPTTNSPVRSPTQRPSEESNSPTYSPVESPAQSPSKKGAGTSAISNLESWSFPTSHPSNSGGSTSGSYLSCQGLMTWASFAILFTTIVSIFII